MTEGVIEGAKGKGGGGRAAVEAPDTRRSVQTAQVVDLWCEGEIQGLVNGLKSVYLDGVPLQNADGSMNFENVLFAHTLGTQGQGALPGFDTVQNEVAVGVTVPFAAPVTRTITNPAVDAVRVTLAVPQLTNQSTATGDLNGSTFEYAIEIQSAGGGFVERARATLTDKVTSVYKFSRKLELSGPAPWDIRVKRISADSGSSAIVNAFNWESYTEIESLKLRYPNSALGALQVSARQFGAIPTRAYDLLLQRVQVPVNWDPITRVYTGVWNGTFKTAWTDNPAWIFRELATHPRWGLGQYITAAQVNKWPLYKIAQYCDGMVDRGNGQTEPRFTCNLYLQTREQARKVLQDLAAVFRAIAFWAGGELQVVQDAPADPVLQFAPGNVVNGHFEYQGQSGLQRHSVFIVYYNDLTQLGKRVPEVYAPDDLVARYGIRELELSPIGVSSRGQAQRLARWAAYSEEMEAEVVSFRVGAEGQIALPGQIFEIADPNEAGERLGGRVRSATTAQVTLDAPVTLQAGESYSLKCQFVDPGTPNAFMTQERAVTTAAGTTSVLNVSPAFTTAPAAQSTWLLASDAVLPTTWRCIGVAEVAGADEFELQGVAHHPGKYALIEQGIALTARPLSRLTLTPPPPTSLSYTETVYRVGAAYRSRLTVSWAQPAQGLLYALSWRHNGGPWTDVAPTSGNCLDIDGLGAGTVDLRVLAQNTLGNVSAPLTGSATVVGRTLGLGIKPNTKVFAGTLDYAECYLHGINLAGVAIDAPGATLLNGVAVPVPNGPLYTSQGPQQGWIMFDTAGATFATSLGNRPFAFVRKSAGQWQYDNNTAWVNFAVTATRFLIGSLLTGNADGGGAPGVTGAVVWSEALGPDALAGLGETALWDGLLGVPYETIYNNDDAVALGFNPTLSAWPMGNAYPDGWTLWSGAAPIRETAIVRVGANAARWNGVSAGGNEGMTCVCNLSVTPLPVGTFLQGSIDIWLVARTSGTPGIMVRLYTNAGLSTYVDTVVPAPSAQTGVWQRVPWSARVATGQRIYGIRVYIVATWGSTALAFAGSVVFQNLRFMLADSSTDNKSVTIDTDGTLGGAGGGQVTITGLGYLGDLNATSDLLVVLDGAGMTRSGNTITRASGGGAWDAGARGVEFFYGGAFVSALPGATNKALMFGLSSDPSIDANYTSIDYAWYLKADGTLESRWSGSNTVTHGAYTTATALAITYDNGEIKWVKDGALVRSKTVSAGLALAFDSSYFTAGGQLTGLRVGPNGARGTDGVAGLNNAPVYIYKRAVSAPALPTTICTYTFATGVVTGMNNGWTATVPAGNDPLYVGLAAASAAGPTDTIAPAEWASPVIMVKDGLNAATVYLFKRTSTTTPPALPTTTTTYTFASGVATGMDGGWTQTLPASGGAYRWVTTGSALSAGPTDTIGPSEWASAAILAEDGEDALKFFDTFDAGASHWQNYSGGGEVSIVSIGNSTAGGNALVVGNNSGLDGAYLIHDKNIPFEPGALYRMRVRVARTAGSGSLYAGIAGVGADGAAFVSTSGANSVSGQHYITLSAYAPPTGGWYDFEGYFSGTAATGESGAHPDPAAPAKLHQDVRYIRPLLILNYSNVTGSSRVDYVAIEKLGATGDISPGAATGVLDASGGVSSAGTGPGGSGATDVTATIQSLSYTNDSGTAMSVQLTMGLTGAGVSYNGVFANATVTLYYDFTINGGAATSATIQATWPDSATMTLMLAPSVAATFPLAAGDVLVVRLRVHVVHTTDRCRLSWDGSYMTGCAIKR